MTARSYRFEQIIKKLRQAEVLFSQGEITGESVKKIGAIKQTYCR